MAIALSAVLDSKLAEIGVGQGAAKSLTDADIQALAALTGGLLVPALDMIDHSDGELATTRGSPTSLTAAPHRPVVRLETPHGRVFYQVRPAPQRAALV